MNGGCAAGSSSAAAEATTKRPELDVTEEARKKSHVDATGSSRKRPYEYSEHEMDVTMEKLYKCNYWEDPTHAARVRYYGSSLLARPRSTTSLSACTGSLKHTWPDNPSNRSQYLLPPFQIKL